MAIRPIPTAAPTQQRTRAKRPNNAAKAHTPADGHPWHNGGKRRHGNSKERPTPDELRRVYDSGLTQPELAERYHVANSTMRRWMQEAGIETRKGRPGANPPAPATVDEIEAPATNIGPAQRLSPEGQKWVAERMAGFRQYIAERDEISAISRSFNRRWVDDDY